MPLLLFGSFSLTRADDQPVCLPLPCCLWSKINLFSVKPALDRDHESEWYYTTESRVVYDVHLTKHPPLLVLGQRVGIL